MKIYRIKISSDKTVTDTLDNKVSLRAGEKFIARDCCFSKLIGDEPPTLRKWSDGFFIGDPNKVGYFLNIDACIVLKMWEIK